MDNLFNAPAAVFEGNLKASENKTSMSIKKTLFMGVMAGMFIALGAATSNTAAHDVANVGLARMISGAIFPVGLMMIVLCGAELFTGNCLIAMAVMDKRVKALAMIRNLLLVYFSNMVGGVLIAYLTYLSGNMDYTGGKLGAYTIKIAVGKAGIDPVKGIVSGILCNVLVCIAVLMAGAAKDIGGKIWAMFFPIFAFVIGGFEHCVANMYYIPAGMIAKLNPTYVDVAINELGVSADKINALGVAGFVNNLIWVTIGNILGGMVFIGFMYYMIHIRKEK